MGWNNDRPLIWNLRRLGRAQETSLVVVNCGGARPETRCNTELRNKQDLKEEDSAGLDRSADGE